MVAGQGARHDPKKQRRRRPAEQLPQQTFGEISVVEQRSEDIK